MEGVSYVLVYRIRFKTFAGKAVKATALLFPLLGIPHLLFCINPKDNGTLEEAYMIVNAFVKSSQVQMALKKAYMRSVAQRNSDSHYRCRRGLSQTSGTYISSHSEGSTFQSESNRKKRPPSRTVIRLQEVSKHQENKGKVETSTLIF
ncbi:uncharacterized protein NPIL_266021 [Nephila pilipes]|uniref:Uncharacterized protein n=2 Tax=Nephila pilipes TaxID=299642 RepID=A0A8X6NUH0_NEPPI|nr:uncharacterized protein NPIL_266021 [Nephila pilipes]